MELLLVYLLLINAVTCLLMLVDKRKAQKNRWRIPESTLMLTALLGGSPGCLAGMYLFRHKTRHIKFTLGIPVILAVQIVLLIFVWQFVK